MGYDRSESFPFDSEPNGISFGSENLKGNCLYDHIPFNVKGNGNKVFSVYVKRYRNSRTLFRGLRWSRLDTYVTCKCR